MAELRFSELSARRQAFIRRCQRIGFGKIVSLSVCQGEPVFGPRTEVLFDVKLDGGETRRPELDLADFVLCTEMIRLFNKLDVIRNGSIEQVEIRSGVAVRLLFKDIGQE